jgi:hypothetical protein
LFLDTVLDSSPPWTLLYSLAFDIESQTPNGVIFAASLAGKRATENRSYQRKQLRMMDLLPSKSLFGALRLRRVSTPRIEGNKGVTDNKGSHLPPHHRFSAPVHRSDSIVGPTYKSPRSLGRGDIGSSRIYTPAIEAADSGGRRAKKGYLRGCLGRGRCLGRYP